MKLRELRQHLKEYADTFYLRKFIVGEHERAKRLKTFVHRLKYQPDDYNLSSEDVFTLLREVPEIAEVNSNLELMQNIKKQLGSNLFFELYVVLSKLKLISERNFVILYELPAHTHLFLYRVFCSDVTKPRVVLSQDILNTTLAITPHIILVEEIIEQTFRLLYNKKLLKSLALNLLQTRIKEINSLYYILQELHKAGCLNEASLELLASVSYLYLVENLLIQLNKAKIPLESELIKALCTSSSLFYLEKLLAILFANKKTLVDGAILRHLLKKDYGFFIEKTSVLELLQQHDLLDEDTFYYVCSNNVFSLMRILGVLSEQSLVKENKELINRLMSGEQDGPPLYKAINYLRKVRLLDQDSLNTCVEFARNKRVVCGLLDWLEKNNLGLDKAQLHRIFSLSISNIRRLTNLLEDLRQTNLLDIQSFGCALERVAEKFPAIEPSLISKCSRKDTGAPRSEFLLDNEYRFFIEHGSRELGGCGSVKKGYDSADAKEPRYAIKRLISHRHVQEEAAREVKYHRLLGRNATYFVRDNITSVVSQWQPGKGLHHYSKAELCNVPINARLRCLSSGLKDLDTLHQHYRKHGDVKCQNFVLNLDHTSMRLIDFGTSHKKGSFKLFGWTSEYLDPKINADLLGMDLYAMGIVTMHLFPELYRVSFANKTCTFSLNKSDLSIYEQCIVSLVNAMMTPELGRRCTSEDALNYCNEVINYFDTINTPLLEEIAANNIHRAHDSFEDILRM
ncbi:protein kinase family protein [Legionella lytica]|uniref:Protein kinase family protein n=1 Tax=Legionella lytica TaxID=96232 RepID=A0ABW8D9R4_9GAMM